MSGFYCPFVGQVEHIVIEGNCAEIWWDEKEDEVETQELDKTEVELQRLLKENQRLFESALNKAAKAIGDRMRFEDVLLDAMREQRKWMTSFSDAPRWYSDAVELLREFRDEE